MFTILLNILSELKILKKGFRIMEYGTFSDTRIVRIWDWWIWTNNRFNVANLLNSVEISIAYHVASDAIIVNCPLISTQIVVHSVTDNGSSLCSCVCVFAIVSFRFTYTKNCSAYSEACPSYTVVKPVSHVHNRKGSEHSVPLQPMWNTVTHIFICHSIGSQRTMDPNKFHVTFFDMPKTPNK